MLNIKIDRQDANVTEVDNDGVKLTQDVDYTVSLAEGATGEDETSTQDTTPDESTGTGEPSSEGEPNP